MPNNICVIGSNDDLSDLSTLDWPRLARVNKTMAQKMVDNGEADWIGPRIVRRTYQQKDYRRTPSAALPRGGPKFKSFQLS